MHRWHTCCMPSLVESCLLFLRAGLSLVPSIWYLVLSSSPFHFIWVNLNNLFGCSYNLRSISSSATAVIKVNIFSNTCNVLFVRLNYILNHPTLSKFLFGPWSYYSNVNWKLCICYKYEPSISTSRQKICQTSSDDLVTSGLGGTLSRKWHLAWSMWGSCLFWWKRVLFYAHLHVV